MSAFRFGLPLAAATLLAACTGSPATPSPTGAATPTVLSTTPAASLSPTASAAQTPSSRPSAPAGSLDPNQSDAGVVAEVTVTGDARANRDGTYSIAGRSTDGSDCGLSFDGTEYDAVAFDTAAASGQISRLSVTVTAADIPAGDGSNAAISGRVSFDFAAESAVGATYTGDANAADNSRSSIDIARSAGSLRFNFTGTTWDNVTFAGSTVCAEAGLGG